MPIEQERKAAIRERVWAFLEATGAAPPGVRGRIPAFAGSEQAADRLTRLPDWQQARTVQANPDQAQQPVRRHALQAGKMLFMAVPNLTEVKPFYRLDPARLGEDAERAGDRHVAAQLASTVAVSELPPIDLVVCGSVAVNRCGVRLGKGAGYSDIEVGLLAEAGLLRSETTIVTTVHELQVVDDDLPRAEHDFTVDVIVTPEQVIHCTSTSTRTRRPVGIAWDQVTSAMIAAMPVLDRRRQRRER